jgi:C4-dicarboxylate-specific signal transduction histidine kinase
VRNGISRASGWLTPPRGIGPWLALWGLLAALSLYGANRYLQYAERQTLEQEGTSLLATARALEQVILRTLEGVEGLHALLQTRHEMLLAGNQEGAASIGDLLSETVAAGKFGVRQVSSIQRDGTLEWSTLPGWRPIPLADREHFVAHESSSPHLFLSAPVIGRFTRRWTIHLSRPLLADPDGGRDGVSVVSLDPFLLSAQLAEVTDSPTAVASLLRAPTGELLARSRDPERHFGRSITPTPHSVLAARDADRGYMRTHSVVNGREIVVAYRKLQSVPLVIAVLEEWDTAAARLRVLQRWVLGSLAATLALMLAILLFALKTREARNARRALMEAEAAAAADREAQAELERLLAASPAAVYAGKLRIDEAGDAMSIRKRFMSLNTERVVGWPAGALSDEGAIADKLDPADLDARREFRRKLVRSGIAAGEYRLRDPAGQWRWIREEARVVAPERDGTLEIVSYLSDITEQRRVQAQALAASKMASLGEMAAGMAHELNQPLAVVSLAAENAAEALEHEHALAIPETIETLELIAQQTTRCKEVVQHLRRFSQPQMPVRLEAIALSRVLQGALLLVRTALRDAKIALEAKLPEGLPPVFASQVGAEQVLVNLLLNARDAMVSLPPGETRMIRIEAEPEGDCVQLSVADTGGGIPPAIMDRIFEPLFTTKAQDKGTGLGLSLCYNTMRSFGGSIVAGNTMEGAVFRLRFRAASESGSPEGAEPIQAEAHETK